MQSMWYLVLTAPLLSYASIYECNANQTCNINCTGIVNNSNPLPTQCSNLTVYAQTASLLTVTCQNNTYCDNMKIYCPPCPNNSTCYPFNTCTINCTGDDNVCNQIEIYNNKSSSHLLCSSATKNGKACTNAKIYEIEHEYQQQDEGLTDLPNSALWFVCDNATICDSVSITSGVIKAMIKNSGIMNNLNVTMPNGQMINIQPFVNGYLGVYINAFISSSTTPQVVGGSFINCKFYSGLSYILFNVPAMLANNVIYGGTDLLLGGSGNMMNNTIYDEISMRIFDHARFHGNNIYANDSTKFSVDLNGANASMSHNNIYIQNAMDVEITVENYRCMFNDNNIYAQNVTNFTVNVQMGRFVGNKIYGQNINKFILFCMYDQSQCGSVEDVYLLSNANSVSIQAGAGSNGFGGLINATYFDVKYVDRLSIFSDWGWIRNINVDAAFAKNVNITMESGALYNSTINASMVDSLRIKCNSFDYWHDLNDTNCNGLTLMVPPPSKNTNDPKTSLLCDGKGCEKLILYTINGAEDINVTGTNCDCNDDPFITSSCIDEWEIYCKENNYIEPSIFSSANSCDGACCDNVVNQLDMDWDCSTSDDDGINGLYIALIVIGHVALIGIGVLIRSKCRPRKEVKKQPLLVQE